ncbi:MAG: alpha/beta fold hydrolase [Armatimonadota bacterium]
MLLHAGLSDLRTWSDQVGALARDHRVIRYDLRGYGRSAATDHETPHRQDLYELLGFLKIDAASICGLSLGGYTAIDFALDHPDRVHALIPVFSGFSGYHMSTGRLLYLGSRPRFPVIEIYRRLPLKGFRGSRGVWSLVGRGERAKSR